MPHHVERELSRLIPTTLCCRSRVHSQRLVETAEEMGRRPGAKMISVLVRVSRQAQGQRLPVNRRGRG